MKRSFDDDEVIEIAEAEGAWTGSFKIDRYSSIDYDGGTCTYCDAIITQEDHTFKEDGQSRQ
jgi:hypothetical protein